MAGVAKAAMVEVARWNSWDRIGKLFFIAQDVGDLGPAIIELCRFVTSYVVHAQSSLHPVQLPIGFTFEETV